MHISGQTELLKSKWPASDLKWSVSLPISVRLTFKGNPFLRDVVNKLIWLASPSPYQFSLWRVYDVSRDEYPGDKWWQRGQTMCFNLFLIWNSLNAKWRLKINCWCTFSCGLVRPGPGQLLFASTLLTLQLYSRIHTGSARDLKQEKACVCASGR